MKELLVPSDAGCLYEVLDFISECLSGCGVTDRSLSQLELAVEEIFVNIALHAYPPTGGEVAINCSVEESMMKVTITFTDGGVPFDPLQTSDPDLTIPLDERPIGGLGIFLVKKNVDGISYRRREGKNILTIEKFLQ